MKISLITACYNSAGTIRTAVESVLSQKGVDIEYIVVDGGSKDGTVEVVEELSRKERKDRKDDGRVERVGLCLGGRSWSSELELESGVLGVRSQYAGVRSQ